MSTQAVQPAQEPSDERITVADHFAEIIGDEGPDGKIFHWIVQRVGSPEILMWGQEPTHEEACSSAKSYLQSTIQKDNIQPA